MTSNHHSDPVFVEKRKPKGPIKFKINLNEEQKAAKEVILQNPITLLKGMAGSGKAQPLTATVYTPTGPKPMGSIKVGDVVLGKSGPTEVLGVFPQGEEDVYRITCSDGSTTEASLQHLWTVQPKKYSNKQGNWKTVTTQDLILDLEKGLEYRLPTAGTVNFVEQEVPLAPYLLGVLLSEGCLRNNSISFSTAAPEVLKNITQILEETDAEIKHLGNYDYRFKKVQRDNSRTFISLACEDLGLLGTLSYDKHIPEVYKYNSEQVRVELLKGMIDGDGYVTSKGKLTYSTSSEQLAKDVAEMFQSLGGRTTTISYFPKYTYQGQSKTSLHLHYTVSITIADSERFATIPFKLERLRARKNKVKYVNRIIKKIEKIGVAETQCIKVSAADSLYLTDNFIVTHNTLLACQIALDLLFKKDIEKIIITRPTVAREEIGFLPGDIKEKLDPWLSPIYANLYLLYDKEKIDKLIADGTIEIVPFAFMRGRTFPNSMVIVDECQNITHGQTELVLGRLGRGGKMVFCGDLSQVDLKSKKDSGIGFFNRLEENIKGVRVVTLKTNHRHEIVEPILKVYEDYRD